MFVGLFFKAALNIAIYPLMNMCQEFCNQNNFWQQSVCILLGIFGEREGGSKVWLELANRLKQRKADGPWEENRSQGRPLGTEGPEPQTHQPPGTKCLLTSANCLFFFFQKTARSGRKVLNLSTACLQHHPHKIKPNLPSGLWNDLSPSCLASNFLNLCQ